MDVPDISLIKDRNKRNIRNEKSLRERERHQTIRQWRVYQKHLSEKENLKLKKGMAISNEKKIRWFSLPKF
jgi:hypothetical protein